METFIQVDVLLLNFVLGSLIPLVTAIFTKVNASSRVKSVFNAIVSIATGAGGYLLLNDGRATLVALATYSITAFLASGVAYQNVWKPTGAAPALQAKTPALGVGPRQ